MANIDKITLQGTDYTIVDSTVPSWAKQPTKPSYSYSEISGTPILANVATSGSYNDLSNKPTIPSAPGTLVTNKTTAQTASAGEAMSGTINLHKIAKTGTYSDLIGTPTIPTVGTLNTNNTTAQTVPTSAESLSGTISLHKVAKTGSYNDLLNKPTGMATESYVNSAIANLVNSAPETLDTLNELAAALGDDPNFATTIATSLGKKVEYYEITDDTNLLPIFASYQNNGIINDQSAFNTACEYLLTLVNEHDNGRGYPKDLIYTINGDIITKEFHEGVPVGAQGYNAIDSCSIEFEFTSHHQGQTYSVCFELARANDGTTWSWGLYTSNNLLQNALTFDSIPTANSTNPVTSDGIVSALTLLRDEIVPWGQVINYDSTPSTNSEYVEPYDLDFTNATINLHNTNSIE